MQAELSKSNAINELYCQLNGIQAVADSITNVCETYTMPVDAQNQIHGISQSIIALTEKADRLAGEIDQASNNVEPEAVSKTSKQNLRWDYWQDDISELKSLIGAALTLNEYDNFIDSSIVLRCAVNKASFINEHMDAVNAGKTEAEIYAHRSKRMAS